MSSAFISLLFAVGAAAFVWSKLARSTGNAKPSSVLIAAGVAGLAVFIVLFSLLKLVFDF